MAEKNKLSAYATNLIFKDLKVTKYKLVNV